MEIKVSKSIENQGNAEKEYEKLQEKYESQSADHTNLQSDIEVLNKEKEELLAALTTEVNKLGGEKEELRENLQNMEDERDSMDEDNTKLSKEIELLKKQLTESEINKKSAQEKEAEGTEPTSVASEDNSQQRLLEAKSKSELEAVKKERDEMMTLLRTKDDTIRHMEKEILPFVQAWAQGQ